MIGETTDKLVTMINQIARNVALDPDPVAMVANHITAFWTPRMKQQIFAHGAAGLDPIARDALARLAQEPQAQGCDAG